MKNSSRRNSKRLAALVLSLCLCLGTFGTTVSAKAVSTTSGTTASTSSSVYPTNYFTASVKGSTGWAGTKVSVYQSNSTSSRVIYTMSRGTVFVITKAEATSNFWKVKLEGGLEGYVQWKYCMINLPDVLPEIEYSIANASSAIYKSSGYSISGITGTQLYSTGKVQNNKIGRKEYLVPVMFKTACKISIAYHNVKLLGSAYNLKVYDAYRPYAVTQKIYGTYSTSTKKGSGLLYLYNTNSTVKNNILYSYGLSETKYTWGTSWFLAKNVSTHNAGAAVDITITKNGTELTMPTAMHELSTAAIKYYSSSCSMTTANFSKYLRTDYYSTTAGKTKAINAQLLDAVMQGYSYTYNGKTYKFVDTGLDPLRSEWWHFQDSDASTYKAYVSSSTDFEPTKCLSVKQ